MKAHRTVARLGRALHTQANDQVAPGSYAGHYLRHSANWFWLAVALIMWSIAWPTLPLTFTIGAAEMPIWSALAVLPLAFVWQSPVMSWAVIAATAAVFPLFYQAINDWPWRWQVCLIISLVTAAVVVFLRRPYREAIPVWVITMALFAVGSTEFEVMRGWALGLTAALVVCWLLRMLVRSRTELAVETQKTEVERDKRAALEDRARIARDLHDIVAHRMSLVVVQAQTAQYRVDSVTPAAQAEFDAIARIAREALNEVRGLLGVLRDENGIAQVVPAPDIGSIERLVDDARSAGLEVSYLPLPQNHLISDATGLVAYRIVQEALANAARHARGAVITVAITSDGALANVTISNGPGRRHVGSDADAGDVADGGVSTGGNGVRGMAERARTVGGTLYATPTADGGFIVVAELPLHPGATDPLADPITGPTAGPAAQLSLTLRDATSP